MAFSNPVLEFHKIANNGRDIGGHVIKVEEDGTKNCYRAEASVDGTSMSFSHHNDMESAKTWAEKMVESYLEVHSK